MNKEKVKLLRRKIPITLIEAINLLKNNEGDINACEAEFHVTNIDKICKEADCDRDEAEKYYKKFERNIKKAIDAINNKQQRITIGNPEKVTKNSIGFIMWFEDESDKPLQTKKNHCIFIPTNDFDYVYKIFATNSLDNFDPTGFNYFSKDRCKLIIKELTCVKDKKLSNFIKQIVEWMNNHLEQATTLVILGNL